MPTPEQFYLSFSYPRSMTLTYRVRKEQWEHAYNSGNASFIDQLVKLVQLSGCLSGDHEMMMPPSLISKGNGGAGKTCFPVCGPTHLSRRKLQNYLAESEVY